MTYRYFIAFGVAALVIVSGCDSANQDPGLQTQKESTVSLLPNALAQLREEKPSLASYRNAVQQLNVYLDKPDKPVELKLDPEARQILVDLLLRVPDSARRLKDVESKTFTVVDANHIDACILFRDAARALLSDLGPQPGKNDYAGWRAYNLLLAEQVFQWTMLQAELTPRAPGSDAWPAHDILRRGTADPEERLRVFLALLEQLDLFRAEARRIAEIDSQLMQKPDADRAKQLETEKADLAQFVRRCKLDAGVVTRHVDYQDDDGSRKTREIPWAAGVLIDGEVYLFEPRLGRPVPAPNGQGVATWKQVRENPKVLEQLYRGDPDAVTPAQLAKAELLLAFSLPALAPRMLWLENEFEKLGPSVYFHQNPTTRLAQFNAVALGLPVRIWSKPGAPGYPLVVMNLYVENPNQELRLRDLLVPRYLLPDWVREMLRQLASVRDQQRLIGEFDLLFLRMRVEPGGVRDLLVRGRPEEAVQRMLQLEDRIDKAMDINNRDFNAVPYMRKTWVPMVIERSQRIKNLNLQFRTAGNDQKDAIMRQILNEAALLEHNWKDRAATFNELVVVWAVPELRGHLTYFMALAKMDMARRAELQKLRQGSQPWPADRLTSEQLWLSAREWLYRYQALMLPLGNDPWRQAVQRHLDHCQQKLGSAAGSQ